VNLQKTVLGLALIAIVLGSINLAYLFSLSNDVASVRKQVEIVVGNQSILLQEPEIAAFLAEYKESGQLLLDAKKEGTVTFYYILVTDFGLELIDGFKKAYPWMDVQYYRAPGAQLGERIKSEAAAGKNLADVVVSDVPGLVDLKGNGLLGPYNPSVAALVPSPPAYKDKDNDFISILLYDMSMAVNTKAFSGTLPQDWTDWINPNPAWKDKVSLGDFRYIGNSYLTLYGLYTKYGPDTTNKILQGLQASNVRIWPGSAQGIEWSVTGERPILFQYPQGGVLDQKLLTQVAGPITWITPKSGIVVYSMGEALLKSAPHPNAARLFYNFLLSIEGQTIILNHGYRPIRPDVRPAGQYAFYYDQVMKGVPLITFDEVQAAADQQKLSAQWAAIIRLT
jgi:iron(III) transport system substrate-binding protein